MGFIDGLDTDNKVVTGGGLTPATGQFEGAYVVRCASLDEAREIAGSDPLVSNRALSQRAARRWRAAGLEPIGWSDTIRETDFIMGQAMPPGERFSVGVARWDGEETISSLVTRADKALYEDKAAAHASAPSR